MKTTNDFPDLGLSVELMLRQQINDALKISATELILKESEIKDLDYQWQKIISAPKLFINDQTSPRLNRIFDFVQSMLGVQPKVRLIVSDYNDFISISYYSFTEGNPCYIAINASFLDVLNEKELIFLIGREMGNLLNGYSRMTQIVRYIYPDPDIVPPIIEHKLHIWDQLSETISDWYGFLVCNNFETCISALLKTNYSFSVRQEYFEFDTFLKNVINNNLDYSGDNNELSTSSYPINPVRIKILKLFSDHAKVESEKQKLTYHLDEVFHTEVYNLTQHMLKTEKSELDVHMASFIARAGLLVANLDGEIDDNEIDLIAYALSEYTLFPKDLIKKYKEEKNINLEEEVKDSLHCILRIKPTEKERLFRFMIRMVTADEKILKEEVQFIFEKGKTIFGYTEKEIARIFTRVINMSQFAFD
jgi:hypothetical protein